MTLGGLRQGQIKKISTACHGPILSVNRYIPLSTTIINISRLLESRLIHSIARVSYIDVYSASTRTRAPDASSLNDREGQVRSGAGIDMPAMQAADFYK